MDRMEEIREYIEMVKMGTAIEYKGKMYLTTTDGVYVFDEKERVFIPVKLEVE